MESIGSPLRRLRLGRSQVAHGWTYKQLLVAVAAAALVGFAAIYPPLLTAHHLKEPLAYGLVIAAVGALYLAVGIGAWHDRPYDRVGVLMVAVGFGYLSYQLSWLPGTIPWEWQYVTGDLELPFRGWLALVYPTGRLRYR